MSTGETFLQLLRERLPDYFVQTWDGEPGEAVLAGIARAFETLAERNRTELRAARILNATLQAKATGTVTVAYAARTGPAARMLAGSVIFKTAWGVEYVLVDDLVFAAIIASPTTQTVAVEARWAGYEANVDEGLVTEWGGDLGTIGGFTWSGLTTDEGKQAFLDGIASGGIAITGSTAMTGGAMGTLELIAQGHGRPVAEGETQGQVRKRLRVHARMVTPNGVRDAVDGALGYAGASIVEPWDGSGFAFGVSGFGEAAFMRSVHFAIVLVPDGSDVAALQELVERVRPWSAYVLVIEAAA